LIIGIGAVVLLPLYRYLKKSVGVRKNLGWTPFVIIGLILLAVAYLLVSPLQRLFIEVINNVWPLSETAMAELGVATRAEAPLPISRTQFMVIGASILLMVGLYNFVQFTKIGKAMRAVAEDKDVAALMGIDVDRVITTTFGLGAILAGAAGVLYALIFRQVHFFMGFLPGLKAFTAAVLGGIGNIPGAMLGGLFLGVFESLGPSLFLEGLGIPAPYQLKDVIAFTMLVLVLIFRPAGIMGVEIGKKKA
jgi:branched-chain amino acid transport system permease protein